jgi:two-component system phosphate regulon sensor histidine kinase PhoR
MRKRPFFWHIFPLFLIVAVVASTIVTLYATHALKTSHFSKTREELKTQAFLLTFLARTALESESDAIDSLARNLSRHTNSRLTVVDPSGRVMADSHEDPSAMDNHGDRPEIIDAMEGDTGVATRFSATLERTMLYVAIPISYGNAEKAVLRLSLPVVSISDALSATFTKIIGAALFVAFLSVLISIGLSRRLSYPLEQLKHGAERFAAGDLSTRLPAHGTAETAQLAAAMNAMAQQLDERIRMITHQRNQQNAILTSMVEGVMAIDLDEHIIMANNAAGRMLGKKPEEMENRWIQEAIRDSEIQRFVKLLLRTRQPGETEIETLPGAVEEQTLQVHGTVLHGSHGDIIGVLVVLHDVTRLKRLEIIRRDFVANVSHELRTPLTSIKGFVETLLDGAMENKSERERFLGIIATHVNRLNAIIGDLLTLSRLEKDNNSERVTLESVNLDPIVKEAVDVCSAKAQEQDISLVINGHQGLSASLNSSLFEQALINLIDNAVKYSQRHATVSVACNAGSDGISVSVTDNGPGIAPEHLPRLFERFYRIDKARSRKLGGTGLGLAIVKHIMNVHYGAVTVESQIGRGSTFSLHLPSNVNTVAKEHA